MPTIKLSQPTLIPIYGSARKAAAVTPNNSTAVEFDRLYVGGAGNIAVQLVDDSAPVTLVNVPAGTFLPLHVIKVMATGTTATNITGLLSLLHI